MSESMEPGRFAQADSGAATLWKVLAVRPRTALVGAALAIMTVGVAMNWNALVAAGIAPLIITALPCAVMCALGLCMSRMGTSSRATEAQPQQSTAESLRLNAPAGRMAEPDNGFIDSRRVKVETGHVEQEQERRPINV